MYNLGQAAFNQSDIAAAIRYNQERLAVEQDLGHKYGIAATLYTLGTISQAQREYSLAEEYFEKTMLIDQELGNHKAGGVPWRSSVVAFAQNDLATAHKWAEETLIHARRQGNLHRVTLLIEGFAVHTTAHGKFERAARLFGAAEAASTGRAASRLPFERAEYDQAVAATRAQLDEEAFAAAWAAGRAMTPDQAIAEALDR